RAAPARLVLLEERLQPLLPLAAGAPLGDPACGVGALGALPAQALRPPGGVRARGQQFADDALHRRVQILRYLGDETDAKRGLSIEAFARDEVPPCCARSDL